MVAWTGVGVDSGDGRRLPDLPAVRGELRARDRRSTRRRPVARIRGDADDVFSHGFICPKGVDAQAAARRPRPRCARRWSSADGRSRAATWDEAFAEIERRLPPILERTAATRVAVYLGNPQRAQPRRRCSTAGSLAQGARHAATSSRASTVDQMPKQVGAGLMFGSRLTIPVPDLDRTDYLLDARAPTRWRPTASLDDRARLRRAACGAIRERGGKSSSSTRAAAAPPRRPTSTCFIRPGTDALLLFGARQRARSPRASSTLGAADGARRRARRGRASWRAAVHARGRRAA